MKHTKGDWETTGEIETEEMTFVGPYVKVRAGGALVMFDGLIAVVGGLNKEQAQANAKLIATAPKLLEACKEAHKALRGMPKWPDLENDDRLDEQLEQAIAESE